MLNNKKSLVPPLHFWFLFAVALGVGVPVVVLAHHDSAGIASRVLGGGRTLRPRSQVLLDSEYRKGERQNRHSLLVTAGAELPLVAEVLALSVEVPYVYFNQTDRGDAGRYGRSRLGLRLRAPLEKIAASLTPWLLVLDADAGGPAGTDRQVFLDEPYADARAGLTAGYEGDHWLFVLRAGGVFPASRLPFTAVDELVFPPWEPAPELVRRETHELKKVTEWQGRLGFREKNVLFFLGALHRTPYSGVVREREWPGSPPVTRFITAAALKTTLPTYRPTLFDFSRARPPTVYREVEAGFGLQFLEDWSVVVGYRYPLYRGREVSPGEKAWYLYNKRVPPDPKEFRLYDEMYNLSVSFAF